MQFVRPTLILVCLLYSLAGLAQSGFAMPPGLRRIEIPFEYYNNFIILKVNFSRTFELRFILDSGAEHTILSKREVTDLWRIPYEREFRVKGSDLKTELVAYLARRIRFDIPDKMTAASEDILVLQEDYFRFEEYAGVNVHGIMAMAAFSRYIIEIDYTRRKLILYDREYFKPPSSNYKEVDIEVFRNKIYINTTMQIQRDSVLPAKFLLDTGAGLPLLLFSNTHSSVRLPEHVVIANIGMGLGGFLEGYTGRVHQVDIGQFSPKGVITYFQEIDTSAEMDYLNNRNGLIGNGLLSRFNVILDYYTEKMWLKPNDKFDNVFVFDRSGLQLLSYGLDLNQFTIQSVLPGSPAAEADIRKGDRLVRIGIFPASMYSLGDILKKFQQKPGKTIKIVVNRDGKRIKKKIVLRDLI
jgi:hypothetical protein